MRTEKLRKSVKGTALKIIIAVLLTWILITAIDAVRFFTSDKQIKPLICLESNGCKCFEWREEVGIGYLRIMDFFASIESK